MKAYQAIRWTLNNAAKEFAISHETLTKNLTRLGISAVDGTFSTAQICAAVFGDLHGEKLGKLRAERIRAETQTEEARRVVLEEAKSLMADWATRVRAGIQALRLPKELEAKLLTILHAAADEEK